MNRVLLISPHAAGSAPNAGLPVNHLSLASALLHHGIEVRVVDLNIDPGLSLEHADAWTAAREELLLDVPLVPRSDEVRTAIRRSLALRRSLNMKRWRALAERTTAAP